MSDVSLDSKLFHSRASRLFENWNVSRSVLDEAPKTDRFIRTPHAMPTSRSSQGLTVSASLSGTPKRIPER